jgi:probable phosphoglycerate mutase
VPGGESYAALAQRASAWLEGICEEDRLIVICHGGTGRVLRGHYTGLSPAETLDLIDEHTVIHALSQGRITSTRSDTPG